MSVGDYINIFRISQCRIKESPSAPLSGMPWRAEGFPSGAVRGIQQRALRGSVLQVSTVYAIVNSHSTGNSIEFVKRDYRYIVSVIYDRRSAGTMMESFVGV